MDNEQSPALAYMAPQARGMSDLDAFNELMKDVDITEEEEQLTAGKNTQIMEVYKNADEAQQQQAAPVQAKPVQQVNPADVAAPPKSGALPKDQRKARDDRFAERQAMTDLGGAVADVALGVSAGSRSIGRNIYNGVVDFLDTVENFAAEKGLGSGDVFSSASRWDDPIGAAAGKDMSTTTGVAKGVTEFVAPLIAIAGSGGSNLAVMGYGAAYNFLAIDPKEQKLQDSLKKTWLRNIPVVADILEGISSKPDDSAMVGRMKNVAMGVGFDAAFLGVTYSASKLYRKITELRSPKSLSDMVNNVADTPKVQADVVPNQVVVDDPKLSNVGTAGEQLELEAFEKGMAQSGHEAPVVSIQVDGTPGVNLTSAETGGLLDNWHNLWSSIDDPRAYKTLPDVERDAAGLALSKDPDMVTKLATWKMGDAPLTSEQVRALQFIQDDATRALGNIADELATDPNNLVFQSKFAKAVDALEMMDKTSSANASTTGVAFRTEQAVASALGVSEKEVPRIVGAQGRKKAMDEYVRSMGGADTVKKAGANVQILRDLSKISKTPDMEFVKSLRDVSYRSGYMRTGDALTKIALNGMLSSPSTVSKAVMSNTTMVAFTSVENYVEVGIGLAKGVFVKNAQRRTLGQANARLSGLMSGFSEAFTPAWKSMKTLKSPRMVRQDLVDAGAKSMQQDDIAFKAIAARGETTGVAGHIVDALSLKQVPVRVLVGTDTFFNHVNYKSFISGEAAALEERMLKAGMAVDDIAEAVTKFKANPPPDVMRAADDFAASGTFTKELEGVALAVDEFIGEANNYIPVARVVVPFFKTKANIVTEVIQRSPFAPLISKQFRTAWSAGGKSQNEALAKVVTGTTTLGVLAWMASQGRISGVGSENLEIQRAMKDNKTVALPTSIKVGDTWVSVVGLDPLASMVNAASFASKASGHLEAGEYQELVVAIAANLGALLSPEEMTDSMTDALTIFRGDRGYADVLAQLPSRFTPAAGIVTDIRQTIDPTTRQSTLGQIKDFNDFMETVKMRYKNQIPYYSKTLSAQRNVWGETLEIPDGLGPDAVSVLASTNSDGMQLKAVIETLDDYFDNNKEAIDSFNAMSSGAINGKIPMELPSRYLKNQYGSGYRMTPREYGVYQRYAAGLDAFTDSPLNAKVGTMKELFYDVAVEYDLFDRDIGELTPGQFLEVSGKFSRIMMTFKEVANTKILGYAEEENGPTVLDKMMAPAYKTRILYEQETIRGGN